MFCKSAGEQWLAAMISILFNKAPLPNNKLWHFQKNIRSCVENECYCPRTVNIWNVNLLKKYLYHQSQSSKAWDSKCLALIAQMARVFGMNPKVKRFSV